MGSTPHHLFLSRVIDHLQTYAHSWILPYLTVMLSTGPLFLSIQWKEYIWSKPARGQEVSVFFPDWFDEVEQTRFFSSFGGSSWHKYDVAFIFWVFPFLPLCLFSKRANSCFGDTVNWCRLKNIGCC